MTWRIVRDKNEPLAAERQVSGTWRHAPHEEAVTALGTKLAQDATDFLTSRDPAVLLDMRDALDEVLRMVMTPEAAARHVVTTGQHGGYHDHLLWNPEPGRK